MTRRFLLIISLLSLTPFRGWADPVAAAPAGTKSVTPDDLEIQIKGQFKGRLMVKKIVAPVTMNLDLGAYYPIQFGEKKELRLSADWFNVFNSQRAVTLYQTFSLNSGVAVKYIRRTMP